MLTLITSFETQTINSYLNCSETSEEQAIQILKLNQFKAKKVLKGTTKDHYYVSKEVQAIYEHYKKTHANRIARRKISNFDDLLYKALEYHEKHFNQAKILHFN